MSISNWFGNLSGTLSNSQAGATQANQQGPTSLNQKMNQHPAQYVPLGGIAGGLGHIVTYSGGLKTLSYPSYYNLLDVDAREQSLAKEIAAHAAVKEQKDFIDSLHAKTKEIMHIVTEINASGDFKNSIKLDKFVREQLFTNKFNDFISSDDSSTSNHKE